METRTAHTRHPASTLALAAALVASLVAAAGARADDATVVAPLKATRFVSIGLSGSDALSIATDRCVDQIEARARTATVACRLAVRRARTASLDPLSMNFAGRGGRQDYAYALGNLAVYGPLRNVLGMSRIRVAYTAGAAIGPDLFRFYRSIGINLKQFYGQTETCAYVCLQPDRQIKYDSVGKPAPGVEIRIADNGEILVKGPMLLKEYYKRPDATVESINADGYFMTGDAGFIDADGHLKIIDRAKDVGKLAATVGGAMFAPNYIENKLKFFPHIKEAVCFGHDREMVCAFINIDMGAVGNWAERRGIPYAGYTDLAGKSEVYELIQKCVEEVNEELARDAMVADTQVHRFLVLHKELDPDDDELTRTRKVRRGFVAEKYAVLIEALYGGQASQFIETEVKFEDGRKGKVAADLVIRDVKTFAKGGA